MLRYVVFLAEFVFDWTSFSHESETYSSVFSWQRSWIAPGTVGVAALCRRDSPAAVLGVDNGRHCATLPISLCNNGGQRLPLGRSTRRQVATSLQAAPTPLHSALWSTSPPPSGNSRGLGKKIYPSTSLSHTRRPEMICDVKGQLQMS